MKKQRKIDKDTMPEKDWEIITDPSIPTDMASFMTGIDADTVSKLRYRQKMRDVNAKASRKYRAKLKKKHIAEFGKEHACYDFWSKEEIEMVMNSEESDLVLSEKLNRTVYSIQKKRQRELKKRKDD